MIFPRLVQSSGSWRRYIRRCSEPVLVCKKFRRNGHIADLKPQPGCEDFVWVKITGSYEAARSPAWELAQSPGASH